MSNFDSSEPQEDISGLQICRICRQVHGSRLGDKSGTEQPARRQLCDCSRPDRSSATRSGRRTIERVALCRCCAARLTGGGSSSSWFCVPCRSAVVRLNNVCGANVVPCDRSSLIDEFIVADDRNVAGKGRAPIVPDFIGELGDWFERVERLERFAERTVHRNLSRMRNTSMAEDTSLADYLLYADGESTRSVVAVYSLASAFAIPAEIVQAAVEAV